MPDTSTLSVVNDNAKLGSCIIGVHTALMASMHRITGSLGSMTVASSAKNVMKVAESLTDPALLHNSLRAWIVFASAPEPPLEQPAVNASSPAPAVSKMARNMAVSVCALTG